ncbi:PREDICTED: uncharacterized protein LOC104759881 [Camelina sativa]|uniref:Uncharacterized protein LOC104759881 n=1 Tax=Camelina sativa TaxID=90675 RepID=A0ABM0X5K3_CAMSA|nr:PREDICTED: uncharacterized protein LOC104759881 [Camelina sativa]
MSSQSETIDTSDASMLHNVNMSNVTKLTASNFLMWNRQVHALLDGYDLAGFLDGSTAAPAATVTSAGTTTVNPAYTTWKRQDKLIYSSLLGAIAVEVQPIFSKVTTSAQIWSTLSSTYAKPSWGHIKQIQQIREQIKHWKKGTRSVDDYVQCFITTRFDQLALLRKPMDHDDQVDYILSGLFDEYKPVVDQIDGRDSSPSLTELQEKLLNFDLKLQSLAHAASSSIPMSANVASYKSSGGNHNNNNNTHSRGPSRGSSRGQWQNHQNSSWLPRQRLPRALSALWCLRPQCSPMLSAFLRSWWIQFLV